MKIDVVGIRNESKKALIELFEVVQKSAKIGCSKVGAEHIVDDVGQEVFLLFQQKLIERFDPDYEAEPWLIEISRRVALKMLRKTKELPLDDEVRDGFLSSIDDGLINERISTYDSFDDNPVSFVDQKRAMEKIKNAVKFPGVVNKPRQLSKVTPVIRKENKAEKVISADCRRLREIRLALCMTQVSFSEQLGISTATLLSYEYGRTLTIKEDIMKKAEELFSEQKVVVLRNKEKFSRPMPEIIESWCQMLGATGEDRIEVLIDVLNVDKSTVYRWQKQEMRPNIGMLKIYERNVKNAIRFLKMNKEKITNLAIKKEIKV